MNNAAIIVPWRMADGREMSFELAQRYNSVTFSDFKTYFSDSVGEKFNVSEARNRGCLQAIADGYDNLIVLDADTIFERDAIVDALKVATTDGGVCYPYTWSIETNEYFSTKLEGGEISLADLPNQMTATEKHVGSGWVMTKEAFFEMNGWDENFVGWGCEDSAFQLACESIFGGTMPRSSGYCYRLWHPERDVWGYGDNYLRFESKYQAAEDVRELLITNMVHRSKLD